MFRFTTTNNSNQENLIKIQGAKDFDDKTDISGVILQNYNKGSNVFLDFSSVVTQNSLDATENIPKSDLIFKVLNKQECMRLNSKGFFGINTPTPSEYLTINGSTHVSSNIFVNNAVNTPSIFLSSTPNNTLPNVIRSSTSYIPDKLIVASDVNSVITPQNLHWDIFNSFLGIKTSNPHHELDVNGNINAITFSGNGYNIDNINPGNISNLPLPVSYGGTGANHLTKSKLLVSDGSNPVYSPTELHWNQNSNYLGINTQTPSSTVDVNGNVNATTFSGNGYNLTTLNPGNFSDLPLSVFYGGTGNVSLSNNKIIVSNGSNPLYSPSELHWDVNSNYLGINTEHPSTTLDVNGEIKGKLFYGDGRNLINLGLNQNALTLNIPSDFIKIQDALNFLSVKKLSANKEQHTINIESGHQLESGFLCSNGDYSHIKIKSTDSNLYLSSNYDYVNNSNIFSIVDAKGPTFDILLDVNNNAGSNIGFFVSGVSSSLSISQGSGLINVNNKGLCILNGANVDASGAIFNDCDIPIYMDRVSTLNAPDFQGLNSKINGISIQGGSRVNLRNAKFSGCSGINNTVYIQGSLIECPNLDLSDSLSDTSLFASDVSIVNCKGSVFSGSNQVLIHSKNNSSVNAVNASFVNWINSALSIENGSTISISDSNIQFTDTNANSFNAISSNGIIFNSI